MRVAVIAGATGLIGKQLLTLLLNDPEYHQVKAITRTPLSIKHYKLQNIVVDFDKLLSESEKLKGDVIFCCLGTTRKKAGSLEAFKKVDHDYPLQLAKITRAQGATQFLMVTALGADKNASVDYNRIKGEVENAIRDVNFPGLHVFRPSLLLGPRDEERFGEDAAKAFYRIFGFLIPKKYKAIESLKVAKAMMHYAREERAGTFVHESQSMQHF